MPRHLFGRPSAVDPVSGDAAQYDVAQYVDAHETGAAIVAAAPAACWHRHPIVPAL